MKFKLEEIQKHSLRCIEKLMNEIINNHQYNAKVLESQLHDFALNKATQIFDEFLNNGLINNNLNLLLDKPFNLQYCIKNNFDYIELSYESSSIKWSGYAKETA